jgi:tetratricopeptide (TPR) repeat protein
VKGQRNSQMARLHKKLQVEEKSRVFARLADTFRRSDHLEEAIELCHRGLVHHPDYASGHIVLGQCYLDLGRLEEARDAFLRALALDEDNILTLRSLGDILFQQGELEEAAGHYRQALQLDPRNRDLMELIREVEVKLEEMANPEEGSRAKEEGEDSQEQMAGPAADELSGAGMMSMPVFGKEVLESTDTEEHRRWLREMTQDTGPGTRDSAGKGEDLADKGEDPVGDGEGPRPKTRGEENQAQDPDSEDRTLKPEPQASNPESEGTMHEAHLSPEETELLRDDEDQHSAKGPPRGMATATLAEIYFQQGYVDKAIEIYVKVLRQHPDDEKSRARLSELRAMRAGQSAGSGGASESSEGADPDRTERESNTLEEGGDQQP